MAETALALIALGGNVGDVRSTFDQAVTLLCDDAAVRLLLRSSDYRTPPWGVTDQPPFINAAIAVSSSLAPRDLLARALAVEPEVLLMDEPCSALDPISTGKIEELIFQLKERYTIVIVTHNMQQAARVAEFTGFFLLGKLIEFDKTEKIFTKPSDKKTEDYITGRFG